MDGELVRQAQWGRFEGMNLAGLTRLSTEEAEGERLPSRDSARGAQYMTGHDIKSTDEQEQDIRSFVESRGGRYVYTYTEPETSAYKRKRVLLPDGNRAYRVVRPVFEGALENLKTGQAPNGIRVDGLIVYDIDRLTRDSRHLEDAIEVVEHYRRPIVDITGTLDLLTDNGRAMARVIVAMANKQSADTGRRVKRKARAMQKKGIPAGGPRPFGWQQDKRTLNESEARLLRDAARRLTEGATWHSIVADWNDREIPTAQGKRWTAPALKAVMGSPRICGYRPQNITETDPQTGKQRRRVLPAHGDDGKPVIGQHKAIISVEEWEAIVSIIETNPRRGTGYNARKYLGSGTLRCGKDDCGAKLRGLKASPASHLPSGHHYYACPSKGTGQGCGGISVAGPATDELIRKLLIAHYEEQAQRRKAVVKAEAWPKEEQLARTREDVADLKQARKDRLISVQRYYQDLAEYEAEEQELVRERNAWNRKTLTMQGEPVDIAKEWDRPGITLAEKRAYLERVFSAIIVLPVGKGTRVPLRERIVPLPCED